MDTVESINGKLQAGGIVLVNSIEDYGCLVGTVTAIDKQGSPEHDTHNETDDVHIDFLHSEYTDWRKLEIEKHFESLTGNSVPFDMLPLDDVIMPPQSLIRVTDLSHKDFAEILGSFDNAKNFGDCLQRDYFDGLEKTLIERVEQNYADYNKSLLSFGQRELIDMAATIHAYSDCWSYLTEYHAFSDAELKFLTQFDNPLEIVAVEWHKRNIDAGEVEFALDFIMELERQTSALEVYSLYSDKPASTDANIKTELPQNTPQERLYAKMSAEFHSFLDDMRSKSPDDILEASYQTVFMYDLLLTIENGDIGEDRIDALLTLDTPLGDLYWNWLDTDVSYMDRLRDCVEEYADVVISERREAEQAKTEQDVPAKSQKQEQKPLPKQPPDTLLGEIREAAREVEARKTAQPAPTKSTKKEIDSL